MMFWLRFKMFLFVLNTERGHFLPLTLKKKPPNSEAYKTVIVPQSMAVRACVCVCETINFH